MLFELLILYAGGKLQQKSKFYVYGNLGKIIGQGEFCLSADKDLSNGCLFVCLFFREVVCVVLQLGQ